LTKPGRIPCINPTCRRTAARDRDDDPETEIICGKCFRALPVALRGRYKQLSQREKRLLRLADRAVTKGEIGPDRVNRIARLIETARAQNWGAVRQYFQRPDRPAGLEGFLQEVGL
jgi:hypothetical protein